jgi:hypothetical protein
MPARLLLNRRLLLQETLIAMSSSPGLEKLGRFLLRGLRIGASTV